MSATTPSGLQLWLKADAGVSGSTWSDQSGNGNHATAQGSPTLESGALNGMPVMRYHGVDGQYHSFTNMTNIRTIFWVVKDNPTRYSSLLGDNNQYHFHPENNRFWHNNHTSGHVKNGALAVNGTTGINGVSSNKPTTYSVVSLRTTGNIEGSNFYSDRNIGGRTFKGDLAELLMHHPQHRGWSAVS